MFIGYTELQISSTIIAKVYFGEQIIGFANDVVVIEVDVCRLQTIVTTAANIGCFFESSGIIRIDHYPFARWGGGFEVVRKRHGLCVEGKKGHTLLVIVIVGIGSIVGITGIDRQRVCALL